MGTLHYLSGEFVEFEGKQIRRPRTKKEYLKVCKRFMSTEQYEYFLLALMDDDYLPVAVDLKLDKMVEFYWKFDC